MQTTRPPGWYADPWRQNDQRWWDGNGWTDRTRSRSAALDEALAAAPPQPQRSRGLGAGAIVAIVAGSVIGGFVLLVLIAGLAMSPTRSEAERVQRETDEIMRKADEARSETAPPVVAETTVPAPISAEPPPEPLPPTTTAPPARPQMPGARTVNLKGSGGVKSDPFPLVAGRYAVAYVYQGLTSHGFEQCYWSPSIERTGGEYTYEPLPNATGGMKGTTNVYVEDPGDYYIDLTGTLAECHWAVTFTPAPP